MNPTPGPIGTKSGLPKRLHCFPTGADDRLPLHGKNRKANRSGVSRILASRAVNPASSAGAELQWREWSTVYRR